MTRVLGIDVSEHQGNIDFGKAYQARARFVAIRATVGDYYTDPNFASNYSKAKAAGLLVTAYHAVAPADVAGRRIDAPTQMQRFRDTLGGRHFDLPLALDAELERGQSVDWITTVMLGCVERIPYFTNATSLGMIYTRQTWWDKYLKPSPEWKQYCLWPARSKASLTSPWSDGACRFRDWTDWRMWQFSGDYDYNGEGQAPGNFRGAEFGVASQHVDINWFNGDLAALKAYCAISEPAPEPEEQIWAAIEALQAEQEKLFLMQEGLQSDLIGQISALRLEALLKADVSRLKVSLQ